MARLDHVDRAEETKDLLEIADDVSKAVIDLGVRVRLAAGARGITSEDARLTLWYMLTTQLYYGLLQHELEPEKLPQGESNIMYR